MTNTKVTFPGWKNGTFVHNNKVYKTSYRKKMLRSVKVLAVRLCLFKSDNLAQNQRTVQRTIFLLFVFLVSFLSKVDGKHSRQKSWVCLQTGIWFSASEVSSLLWSLKTAFNSVWRTKWYVFHHQRSKSKRVYLVVSSIMRWHWSSDERVTCILTYSHARTSIPPHHHSSH